LKLSMLGDPKSLLT